MATDMAFELHPQLAADTFAVCDLELCSVLLMDDTNYPWLILVPRRQGLRDFHNIATGDAARFLSEINHVSVVLEAVSGADKMNVAALGNMVPQLHVHIIARFDGDAAWPGPVWGKVPAQAYSDEARDDLVRNLRNALSQEEN